jgi:hypothetical protein
MDQILPEKVSSPEKDDQVAIWNRRSGWITFTLFMFLYFSLSLGTGFLQLDSKNPFWLTLAALFANIIASYGSVLIVAVLLNKFSLQTIGFRKTGWLWIRRAFYWGLALMVIRAFLAQGLLGLFPFLNFGTEILQQSLITNNASLLSQIIVIVLGALVIPVGEELFFRGFLFRWMRNRLTFRMAILISALVFGAFHLIPIQALMAFPLGVLNAWMFERSRSLWPPIVLHVTNNLFTLVIAFAVLMNQ